MSYSIPNLCSKKWSGTLLKYLAQAVQIQHILSLGQAFFFNIYLHVFANNSFSEYSLSSLYFFQVCIRWDYQAPPLCESCESCTHWIG